MFFWFLFSSNFASPRANPVYPRTPEPVHLWQVIRKPPSFDNTFFGSFLTRLFPFVGKDCTNFRQNHQNLKTSYHCAKMAQAQPKPDSISPRKCLSAKL